MKVYHRDQTDAEKARSKRGKKSGRKGKRFEQDVAKRLREVLPKAYTVYRRPQNETMHRVPDVSVSMNGRQEIGVECKHRDKVNLLSALDQAIIDTDNRGLPVAVCKETRQAAVVVMLFDDWLQLIAEAKGER